MTRRGSGARRPPNTLSLPTPLWVHGASVAGRTASGRSGSRYARGGLSLRWPPPPPPPAAAAPAAGGAAVATPAAAATAAWRITAAVGRRRRSGGGVRRGGWPARARRRPHHRYHLKSGAVVDPPPSRRRGALVCRSRTLETAVASGSRRRGDGRQGATTARGETTGKSARGDCGGGKRSGVTLGCGGWVRGVAECQDRGAREGVTTEGGV